MYSSQPRLDDSRLVCFRYKLMGDGLIDGDDNGEDGSDAAVGAGK